MIAFASAMQLELDPINKALRDITEEMPAHLRDIASHTLTAGGKRLRPLLTLFSARLFGASGDELYSLAAIPEMIHAATLLHDDVLDNAATRRGQPAAHTVFGAPQSILAGDALLSMANYKAASYGNPDIMRCVSESVLMTAEGEVHEMHLQHKTAFGQKEYVSVIAGKTGWLLRCACRLGALYAGAPQEAVEAISTYGLNLGIAFQIVDDALDFADEAVTGKPSGGDLMEGKCTPPVMLYLDFLPIFDRENFRNRFRSGRLTEDDRLRISADIRRLGFDEKTREMAGEYLDAAGKALDTLADARRLDFFRDALAFVQARKK